MANMNDNFDQWSLAHFGKFDDKDVEDIMRLRNVLDLDQVKKQFPIRAGIAIPVVLSGESNEKLFAVEDWITKQLGDKGMLVAVISSMSENFKEFVFYTQEDLSFTEFHKAIKDQFQEFEIQMYANKDLEWDLYKEFFEKIHTEHE